MEYVVHEKLLTLSKFHRWCGAEWRCQNRIWKRENKTRNKSPNQIENERKRSNRKINRCCRGRGRLQLLLLNIFFNVFVFVCLFYEFESTDWVTQLARSKTKTEKKNCGNKRKRVRSCSSICRSLWTHFSSHSSRLLSGCGKRANVAIYTSIYTKMNDEKSSILHWIKDANSRKKRPTEKYQPSRRQAMK